MLYALTISPIKGTKSLTTEKLESFDLRCESGIFMLTPQARVLCLIYTCKPQDAWQSISADSLPIRGVTLDLLYSQLKEIRLWASTYKQ